MVLSASEHGAETKTFFAPALICIPALSLDVNNPVHSKAISIFNFFQGNLDGSLSE